MTMKKVFLVLCLALPALLVMAQDSKLTYETKPLNSELIKNIEMQTSGGLLSVDVRSGSGRISLAFRSANTSAEF